MIQCNYALKALKVVNKCMFLCADEKFTLVFMTFFRRFMKPGELVEILTER